MKSISGKTVSWSLAVIFACTVSTSSSVIAQPAANILGVWHNGDGFQLDFRQSGSRIAGVLVKVPPGWKGRQRRGAELFSNGVVSGGTINGLWSNYAGKDCAKLPILKVKATISFKDSNTLSLASYQYYVGSETHKITGEVRNCHWLPERDAVTLTWHRVGSSSVGTDTLVTADDVKTNVLNPKGGKKPLFDLMDKDGNGCLSRDEIISAVNNPAFKGKDAESVALIYNNPNMTKLAPASAGDKCTGVSKADIAHIADEDSNKEAVFDGLDAIRNFKDKTNGQLFGPGDSVNPEAVQQGGIGDCNFLSPLTSFANTPEGKKAIREMIKPAGKDANGNDQYTVTFHDPKDPSKTIDVTVSKPTEAELINFAKGTKHGLWPAVIEKAYGNWRKNHDADGNVVSPTVPNGHPPQLAAEGFMPASNAITMITGKPTEKVSINSYTQTLGALDKDLTKAFSGPNKPIMTANIEGGGEGDRKKPAPIKWLLQPRGGLDGDKSAKSGLTAGHEYSVTNYDPKTQQVTVRNPYGYNVAAKDPSMTSKDGSFKMSLEDFRANFSGYTVAK